MAGLIKLNKRQNQGLATAQAEHREQYLAFTVGGETFAYGHPLHPRGDPVRRHHRGAADASVHPRV